MAKHGWLLILYHIFEITQTTIPCVKPISGGPPRGYCWNTAEGDVKQYSLTPAIRGGLVMREFPGTLKYEEAHAFCQSQGMRLPVLTSPYSQSLALAALGTSPETEYWIGLDYKTGSFRWADNSPLCWKNWFASAAGEPNNLDTELCVAMRGTGSVPGAWLTKNCATKYGVLCEVAPANTDYLYNKMEDATPTGTALTSFPVTTETACVWLCELTPDCIMAAYDGRSRHCYAYGCGAQVTSSNGQHTWVKQ